MKNPMSPNFGISSQFKFGLVDLRSTGRDREEDLVIWSSDRGFIVDGGEQNQLAVWNHRYF